MTDLTSTPFLRQLKMDCEELHAKLARDKAVAETRRAGGAGCESPEVFSDPAPSSVEER